MANNIHILPDILINKIAAGEVVEKPVSVVKELVENSVDAGAKNIRIEIRQGGKTYVEVADDGKGMVEDDLLLAFERHATSKISEFDDLQKIGTMGFRGEALPSIAAVSIVEASSKEEGSDSGTLVVIKGGVVSDVRPAPMNLSTSIKVKSLFFNVPARRKFLKFPEREYKSIYSYFKRVAVSRPDIGFKLINDEKTVFDLSSGSLEKRITNIFKEISNEELISVENSLGNYKISGYLGKAELARKTKDNQQLFINGRIIESKMISFTVLNSFHDMIPKGYYPFFIFFIDMPGNEIDINVHPSKLTVKFTDEVKLKRLIVEAVNRALRSSLSLLDIGTESSPDDKFDSIPGDYTLENTGRSSEVKEKNASYGTQKPEENKFFRPDNKNIGTRILRINSELIVSENIWQMHNRYIFVQVESGSLIIDQHVAHERILFEKAMKTFGEAKLPSQSLLFPVKVELSYEDRLIVQEITEYLNSIGFILSEFGGNTFIIEETPMGIPVGDEKAELFSLIDNFKLYRKNKMDTMQSVAASFACKRAIKSGRSLTKDEILDLINDLFQCEFPHVCPHGRPVIIDLSIKELNKRFKRE